MDEVENRVAEVLRRSGLEVPNSIPLKDYDRFELTTTRPTKSTEDSERAAGAIAIMAACQDVGLEEGQKLARFFSAEMIGLPKKRAVLENGCAGDLLGIGYVLLEGHERPAQEIFVLTKKGVQAANAVRIEPWPSP